jgi:hypothetical protein
MSDRTNEEKLRILQERLAVIQKKTETKQEERFESTQPVAPVFKEELVNQPNIDPIAPTAREPRNKSNTLRYFIIFFIISLLGYGAFEFIDFDTLLSSETKEIEINEDKEITYHKSEFNGNYLIILNSFKDLTVANAEVLKLVSEGYKCDVFQLSGVSDSEEEIFQTYIGPFNKLKEANQYLNSSISIKEIGKVIELQ